MKKKIKKINLFAVSMLGLTFLAVPLVATSCSSNDGNSIDTFSTSISIKKKNVANQDHILPSTVENEFIDNPSEKTASKYLDIKNPNKYSLDFTIVNPNDIDGSFAIKVFYTKEDDSKIVQCYNFTNYMQIKDVPVIHQNNKIDKNILPSKVKSNLDDNITTFDSYVYVFSNPLDDKGNPFYDNIDYSIININDKKGTFDIVATYNHNGKYYGSTTIPFAGFNLNFSIPTFSPLSDPSWKNLSGDDVKSQISKDPTQISNYVDVSNPDEFDITYSVDYNYDNEVDRKNGQLTINADYSKNGQEGNWSHLYTGFYKYDASSVESSINLKPDFIPKYTHGTSAPNDAYDITAQNFSDNNNNTIALAHYINITVNPNNYSFTYEISQNPPIDNAAGTLTIEQTIIGKGKVIAINNFKLDELFKIPNSQG